jgi:LysR family hydrogen peroxide-inducible transcriptional activator
MLPTLRQLEYAVAVADRKSFHRAARACHVSQPGLSAQIRSLEDALEVRLFERDRRGVLLTGAGEELVRRARAVLAEAQGLAEAARAFRAPLSGVLKLGVIPTIAPHLLPRVLPTLRARHPELRLELHEGLTGDLVARLNRGGLDLLLVALEAPLEDLATRPLFEDPFVAAMPAGHRLAGRRRLREHDLEGEPVLLLDDGHCLRAQALAFCHGAGAKELGDFRASSLATLVEMVRGGGASTLLPTLAQGAVSRDSDLVLVPFAPPAPFRTIGFAWRKSSGREAEFELLAQCFVPPAPPVSRASRRAPAPK